MIKGVIFDLDGVIVFTDRFHYQAWKQIADEMGIFFDKGINNRLRGISRMDSLEIILEQYHGAPLSRDQKEALAEKKNGLYRALLQTMTPEDVPEDVRKTLAALKEKGILIALGSSSKNARFILEQVDLLDAFDVIVDGTMITRSKPDPQVFTRAASLLKLDPAKCLVVEDAKAGIEAALAGGMQSAAVGEAKGCGLATYLLEQVSDLLKLL